MAAGLAGTYVRDGDAPARRDRNSILRKFGLFGMGIVFVHKILCKLPFSIDFSDSPN